MTERLGLPPDRISLLRAYEKLLVRHASEFGLLSNADLARVWDRHVVDSLRALACLNDGDRSIADVGSGAGLPGIPLGIARPELRVSLIEPKRRRAGFLEIVKDALRLSNIEVVMARVEDVTLTVDVALARAFGPPDEVWSATRGLLGTSGRIVYFAGASWGSGVSVPGATVEVCVTGRLASEGPLVMMRPVGAGLRDED